MTRDELLRAWVEALESGKYKQAQRTLRVGDSYCCLGVACEISGLGEWKPIDDSLTSYDDWDEVDRPYVAESEVSTHVFVADGNREEVQLPASLRKRLGLNAYGQAELQTMNDDGLTFLQIAQRIRTMFPDVFATVSA